MYDGFGFRKRSRFCLRRKFMLRFSTKTHHVLLFLSVLAILCFYQPTLAQARRQKKPATPAPTEQTAPAETKSAPVETKPAAAIDDDEKPSVPVRIGSLMVVGEMQHNFTFYKSNDVENALKEFTSFLKFISKTAPLMTRGSDKMSYTEAKAQAKKETDKYVLWMGFAAKDDGYGGVYIDFAQYAVIEPQTGKVLTRSQVKPGQNSIVGGVKQVRVDRRRISAGAYSEMKDCARQIAAILRGGGWLS